VSEGQCIGSEGVWTLQRSRENELAKIAELCSERVMSKGETICSEGTRAKNIHPYRNQCQANSNQAEVQH
jgi:hypothetical protein